MLPRVTSGGGIVVTASVDPTTGQYTYEVTAVGGGGGSGTQYNVNIASGEGHLEVTNSYDPQTETVTFTLNTKDIPVCVAVSTLPATGVEGGFYFVYE